MVPMTSDREAMRSYFDLVGRFPLIVIRDDGHLDEAIAMIDELLCRNLDEGQEAYMEVLENLVESYEGQRVQFADVSESDVLRLLMESNDLTQSQLARETGIPQSTISNVLRGVRRLTRDQIEAFAKYFHVGPAAFLPQPASEGRTVA